MINISIDTSSLDGIAGLKQSDIDNLLDYTVKEITARFAQEWQKQAMSSLHSSRSEYVRNLNVVDEGRCRGAVVLTGFLPNAIEQGAESWDMKMGLLNGPNAKVTEDGVKYNTIPFSWGTPGTLDENFSNVMPQEVYDILRDKGTRSPVTKSDLPQKFQTPQTKTVQLPQSKRFQQYTHKSSIYEGVTKMKDRVTGQNRYGSFRRVSEGSPMASWIHPGFEPARLAEKALADFDVPAETGAIFDAWFSKL